MVFGKENQVFWCGRKVLERQMGHRLPPKVGVLAADVPFTVMDLLPSNTQFSLSRLPYDTTLFSQGSMDCPENSH